LSAIQINPSDERAWPIVTTKLKNWYISAAVIVFNTLLLFMFLNLVLYAIMHLRYGTSPGPLKLYGAKIFRAYPGWRAEDVNDLLKESWRRVLPFEYQPFTQFKERPFRGKFLNIDPAGFRLSKNQAPWPPRPEAINVFMFGGSTTFGYGLPDEETISSYFGDCAVSSSSGHMAVYNFGRGYYFSSQELALFQRLLQAGFVPQVAIFVDGLNDFHFVGDDPQYTTQLRRFMAGELRYSALDSVPMVQAAQWLGKRWSRQNLAGATDYADRALLQGMIDRWLANKKMIEAIAARYGVRTIFVVQPVPMYKYDLRWHLFYDPDRVFGTDIGPRYSYPIMESLRAQGQLGPNVLWLADIQVDKRENLYVDAVHYTAAFSKEIAGYICDFYRKNATRVREGSDITKGCANRDSPR